MRAVVAVCVLAVPAPSHAQATNQPEPPATLTLDRAIDYAATHYPTVQAAVEHVNASAAGVAAARAAYLPRLDSLWQTNRATANNIFGQVLPQSVIPAMSGPVLSSTSAEGVWGTAAGALFSWEPFDFGLRQAGVSGAQAEFAQARASETLTRLDVENAVAAAFLNVLAAQRAATAAQADLDRRNVLLQSIEVLVNNQLRPGADASRASAERAAALTRSIQAQQILVVARTTLARMLGTTAGAPTIDGDRLVASVPPSDVPLPREGRHPLIQVRQAAVTQAHAAEEVLARTDYPRVFVQSSIFARGSGARASGVLDGGANGLGFERTNWAAGVQVLFPNVFDFASLRSRKAAAAAAARSSAALYDEAVLTVTSQQAAAAALLEAARAVAANTPIQRAAAEQSETQARARYNAGLATIVEVADAQSLLAQAEVQDELARVDVWRALLALSVAQGDLTSFLNLVRQP